MNLRYLLELSATILASIGGAAAIIFGFSSWLGKVWADRLMRRETGEFSRELEALKNKFLLESESYKVKLRKSEILFQKELEATSAFVALFRSIHPRHAWPDMDWHDVYDFIASDFHKIEYSLDAFLTVHGAVLGDDVVSNISTCLGIAGDGKFDVDSPEISKEANEAAKRLYEELKAVEEKLRAQVRSQAST